MRSTGPIHLDVLNRVSPDAFVAELGGIFEHSAWVVEKVVAQRPFTSLALLHEAMKAAVRQSSNEQKLALLREHPDLAGKAARAGTMTADSKEEQGSAGLDRLSDEEFARFHELNTAYTDKFGFPFIICVRRHTKESIFRQFERRLAQDTDSEYETALEEVFRITALRLDNHVSAPARLPVHGFMDVHVIDLCRGVPAAGLKVELWQNERSGASNLITATTVAGSGLSERPLVEGRPIPIGTYELQFGVGDYFRKKTGPHTSLWGTVSVRFAVAESEGQYHLPLRISPGGYMFYRGTS